MDAMTLPTNFGGSGQDEDDAEDSLGCVSSTSSEEEEEEEEDWYATLRASAAFRVRNNRRRSRGDSPQEVQVRAFVVPGRSSCVRLDGARRVRVRVANHWRREWELEAVSARDLVASLVAALAPSSSSSSSSSPQKTTEVVAVGSAAATAVFDVLAPRLIEEAAERLSEPNGVSLEATSGDVVVARELGVGSVSTASRAKRFVAKARASAARKKDFALTVEAAATEAGATITGFVRLEVGEGIEVEKEDFAAEVAKAAQG